MARTGKIARLPRDLRDELNRRLDHNHPGRQITGWLNSLPEVQEILAALFDSKPITEHNLSEWRTGGFVEWQTMRDHLEDTSESAQDAAELAEIAPFMADHAARLLTARILVTLSKWNGDPEDPAFARLKKLTSLVPGLTALCRSDHNAAKLHMEQHAFDLASDARATFTKREAREFPVTTPPIQKWSRRFNVPDPGPPVDPHEKYCQDYIYALTHGRPLPTRPGASLPGTAAVPVAAPSQAVVPSPTTSVCSSQANPASCISHPPPPSRPSDPPPSRTKSNQIKPKATRAGNAAAKSLQENPHSPSHVSESTPISSPPSHQSHQSHQSHSSHSSPNPPIPTAIVTKPNVTIPSNPFTSAPSEPARAPGVTDEELWQMRYRDLPGDKVPDWHPTLPFKTLPPPWEPLPLKTPPIKSIIR